MTAHVTHLWRILEWGGTLARHGAPRVASNRDRNTPAPVRRLARIARFGARVPKKPRYAEAFRRSAPPRSSSASRSPPAPTLSARTPGP